MKKRLLCIFLTACLVVSLLPVVEPTKTEAAVNVDTLNKDAFGIQMNQTFDEDEALANNPYGTEGWFPLFTVSELYVAKGQSSNRYWRTYNYNKGEKIGSIASATSSVSSVGKSENNKDGYRMVDTAACDAGGDGQKRYAANVGYKKGGSFELFLTDASGNRVSQLVSIGDKENLEYLEKVDGKVYTGLISVTAGDFDGDGRDSVLVYVPEMKKDGTPTIYMYNITSSLQLQKVDKSFNVFTLLDVSDISEKDDGDKDKLKRNAPVVQLVSADTDKDNVDELVITAGMSNTTSDVTRLQSQMLVYDYIKNGETSWTWNQTYKLNTNGYSGGYSNAKRLRWATSSVGNAQLNNGVDYPEIVTAGWIDKSDGKDAKLTAAIGSYMTFCSSVMKNSYGSAIGSYDSSQVTALKDSDNKNSKNVSEFTVGGHYNNDDMQSLLPVAVFNADGVMKQASILISDTVYSMNNYGQLEGKYRDNYFNDDDDGIGSSVITNGLVQDVVVGNFDGNTEGREQVIFCTSQKKSGHNDYWYRIFTYQKKSGNWRCDVTGYEISNIGYPYMSFSALDTDNDSTIVKVKDASLTYTEPEVLALLEATPYFSEIDGGDIGNSATCYGTSNGSGTSVTTSNGLSSQVVFGYEYEVDDLTAGMTCGFEIEATVENSYTWESSESYSTEYSLEYANDTGENMVIMYRRPVTAWEFEVKNKENTLVLAREGSLITNMISVDEYNNAIEQYEELNEVNDGMLAEPGNPFSYRNSALGLKNAVISQDTTAYSGNGTISQSFTNTTETENSFTYELNTSFVACGKVFGVKAGGGAGYACSNSKSTINTSSITKSGTVTGKQVENYDFNWRFAHWTTTLNDTEIPVLGYVLTDVKAPPSPPENLSVDSVTSTTADISWDMGRRQADEYRIYQVYPDGTNIQVGVTDGVSTSFSLKRLLPNTSYTYAISAYSGKRISSVDDLLGSSISGESVLSEELLVTTQPEGIAKVEITSPENISVRVGENAIFKTDITVSSDEYQATNYQWQKRRDGEPWEDIKNEKGRTLTVNNVQEEDDGTEYRCIFKVSYASSAALIKYYSAAAKLKIGAASVDASLTVTGHDNTGTGNLTNPYKGKANYRVEGTPIEKVIYKEQNVTIPAADTMPELTVYKYNNAYYGIGHDEEFGNDVYYSVTRTSNGDKTTYTAENQIFEINEMVYTDTSGNVVDSLPNGFDSDEIITKQIDGKTCYLMATVEGTPVSESDSRLSAATGYTLYWLCSKEYYEYAADGGKGEKVTGTLTDVYDVYLNEASAVMLGRTENWTQTDSENNVTEEEAYYYTRLVFTEDEETSTSSCAVTQMTADERTSYKYANGEAVDFNRSNLSIVTETVKETIKTPVYTTKSGTKLTLTANVMERGRDKAAKNAVVDFQIVNIKTNAVESLTDVVDTTGKAAVEWVATTSGIYSIKAIVRYEAGYVGTETTAQYYDAEMTVSEDTVEYRLKFVKEGQVMTGFISYGETVSVALQERTVTPNSTSEWVDYTGTDIVYTYCENASNASEKMLNETNTIQLANAGYYSFRAYKRPAEDATDEETIQIENELAVSSLNVKRVSVTITPKWETSQLPESADDVSLVTEPQLPETISLKDIFDIYCEYFVLSPAEKVNASGHFDVLLSYKDYANDDDLKNKILSFQKNYIITLRTGTFAKAPNSVQVIFESGENGSLKGQYSEYYYPMESGSSRSKGEKLRFMANPNEGYGIDYWIINGQKYNLDDYLPEGMEFNSNGTQVNIEEFDFANHLDDSGKLSVAVAFKSVSNTVTFSVSMEDGSGNGTISAINGTGEILKSGANVNNGASVTFTAEPEEGYVVEQWVVNQKIYHWDNTDEVYRNVSLTLDNIQSAQSVVVFFKKKSEENYNVSVSVGNENGTADGSLAVVTAVKTENQEEIALPAMVSEGTSLNFTATVANTANHVVREWQISTDNGLTYTTVKGSGGQTTFTLYNVEADVIVRPVITVAQSYEFKYKVMMNGQEVTDTNIAALTAVSNGQSLNSGKVSAYIPIDFSLTLNDKYYLKEDSWSSNVVVNSDDNRKASISSLTDNLEVVVNIYKKPSIVIDETTNGSIIVTCADPENATGVINLNSGDYVSPGIDITVNVKPKKGYIVNAITINGNTVENPSYSDGNGKTTDDKTIAIENIYSNQRIHVDFVALETSSITYDIVKAVENQPKGSLVVQSDRKGIADYQISSLSSGNAVYNGSNVTLTATPDNGYMVKEWTVNGEVQKEQGRTITDNTLTLTDVQEAKEITVQFVYLGTKMTIQADDNGRIVSAIAGNIEQIDNIADGFTLAARASLKITAEANPGYEVERWVVNNETVMDGETPLTSSTYRYIAAEDVAKAEVKVYFTQIPYEVSWSGTGGTVEAEGYTGDNAEIRGGTQVTFKANPDAGNMVDYWTVNGVKTDSDEEGNSFTFVVPSGAIETPSVSAYEICAVCKKASYEVSYIQPEEHGTLTAKVDEEELVSGDEVEGNTDVTFTVLPEEGYMVGKWTVNGTDVDSQNNNHTVTVQENTEVSVTLIPEIYTITASTIGKGTVTVEGETLESYSVAYGEALTFTANPEDYWIVDHWKVDGVVVTDGVSEDNTTFTLSDIKEEHLVEAIFGAATFHDVSYGVNNSDCGSLKVTADGEELTLTENLSTTVIGGSTLEFTAYPKANMMVDHWSINGEIVENNQTDCLIINKLNKNINVRLSYREYKGYLIPESGRGYTITDVERAPSDTSPETEIRENGTLTFTVSPDKENEFNVISTLQINGYDCLRNILIEEDVPVSGCDEVIAEENEDGSYKITISNVTDEISLEIKAHKLEKVEAVIPNCITEGNIQYWVCIDEECPDKSKKFADEKALEVLEEGAEILAIDKVNGHDFENSSGVFTWNDTNSATLTLTCSRCQEEKVLDCIVTSEENSGYMVYTAVVEYEGVTYTDTKSVKIEVVEPVTEPVQEPAAWEKSVLRLRLSTSKKSIKLQWNKIPEADGYVIYRTKCGTLTSKAKAVKTIKKGTTTKWTDKNMKQGGCYKYYVKAYKIIDGKRTYIKESILSHIAARGGKYTNIKKLKTVSKLSLAVGKKKKLKVKKYYEQSNKKVEKHMSVLQYTTTDSEVATVTSKGIIKAKGTGSCYIYVTAMSGAYVKIRVTVK